MREAEKNVSPRSFQERGGGQNLKYKFKTFGFLDTFKGHIQSNYHTQDYFISPSNRTRRNKHQTNFLCSSLFSFRFEKCYSTEFQGGYAPLLQVKGALPPLTLLITTLFKITLYIYVYIFISMFRVFFQSPQTIFF